MSLQQSGIRSLRHRASLGKVKNTGKSFLVKSCVFRLAGAKALILLILNRIGGNLGTGAASLGTIFGIFYDDAEAALSFSLTGACQFRSVINNNVPLITPRFETFVPAGRTGWFRLFSQSDIGMTGSIINFNPNTAASAGAFGQGHNLHHLTLAGPQSYVLPIFPPIC